MPGRQQLSIRCAANWTVATERGWAFRWPWWDFGVVASSTSGLIPLPPRNAAGGWSVPNPGGDERQWGKLIGVGIYGWGYRGKVTPCRMGDPAGIH